MSVENNNTKEIKIQTLNDYKMVGHETVRVSLQGDNIAEVTYMQNKRVNEGGTIKKLPGGKYEVLSTGEVKKMQITNERNKVCLMRTFEKLKGLIRTNFEEGTNNQVLITLTYKKKMRDTTKLYLDFNKFMKRVRYAYPHCDLEYICVCEPHEGGGWHLHVMMKATNQKSFWIDKDKLGDLWRQGVAATNIKRLKSTDVGVYYTSYFTNLVSEAKEKESFTDDVDLKAESKRRKKGSRLKYYPPNFKFYRCSKGIVEPTLTESDWYSLVEVYGQPVYQKTYEVTQIAFDNDGEVEKKVKINLVHKATFRQPKGNVTMKSFENKKPISELIKSEEMPLPELASDPPLSQKREVELYEQTLFEYIESLEVRKDE